MVSKAYLNQAFSKTIPAQSQSLFIKICMQELKSFMTLEVVMAETYKGLNRPAIGKITLPAPGCESPFTSFFKTIKAIFACLLHPYAQAPPLYILCLGLTAF